MALLVRLEIVRLLRDTRLAAATAVCGAVLLVSGVAAWSEVQQGARVKAAVAAEERARWLGQGEKDPHSAAHYSIYAFKPSPPLQAVDQGVLPFVGEAVWLEAHVQNDLLFRPQQDAALFERLGLVDPAGLLTRFAPLAVFLLGLAAAARDREHGVLALALGTSSSRAAYLAAKAAAVTTVASLLLVAPVAVVGAMSIAGSAAPGADAALRLGVWTTAAVAYVAILGMAAVSVGVAARSVQAAFGALLSLWLVLVLAALPGASAAAAWLRPLPSFQAMKLVLAAEAPAYWTPEAGAEQIATVLRQYGAADERALTINLRGAQLDVAERHAQAVFDREIGGFYDRVEGQDSGYGALGWLSPAVAFDAASAAVAGTDFAHHRHFIDAAEAYRRRLVNRMNADLIANPARNGREHINDIDLWSQIPAFAYAPLLLSNAVGSAAAALAALAGWLVVAAAGLGLTATRLRP